MPLLLSISVTMTGDGGENDFGFCSDALLWRITLCCRLLAGPVSLACVTRASRQWRVSHNNSACMRLYICVRVRVRAMSLKDLSSMLPERSEPGDCKRVDSGVDPCSEELSRTLWGQTKGDIPDTRFNYSIWLRLSSPGKRQPAE